MLPIVYATPYLNYPYLNLPQLYQVPIDYAAQIPVKIMCDQACQFPEPKIEATVSLQFELSTFSDLKETMIEQELRMLLRYLSANISLLKETQFNEYVNNNLKNLVSLFKDVPKMLKRRYIQINKTKEEMTKFIIRRCFQFIKLKINYKEQENLGAEERDKLFYHTFFSGDKEFFDLIGKESIDEMIPFRKDSKLKTINETYLKKLFGSSRFSSYYKEFIDQFNQTCLLENDEKIQNMARQLLKIIINRDISKISNYRRFPWKNHEFVKCEARANEIYKLYNKESSSNFLVIIKEISQKYHRKMESSKLEQLEKISESV